MMGNNGRNVYIHMPVSTITCYISHNINCQQHNYTTRDILYGTTVDNSKTNPSQLHSMSDQHVLKCPSRMTVFC